MGERVRGLDGLRGVAILLVLAGHATYIGGLGYVGVGVFFVLSGYLITGRLMSGQPLRAFYWRRFLRLMPALWVMLAVTSVLFAATGEPVWGWLWEPLSYTRNLTGMLGAGDTPYLHTWSLALEEQFYLVWPLAFLAGGRRMPWAVVGAAVASFALFVVTGGPFATYSPLTTLWPLALGCALRLWSAPPVGPTSWWLVWLGVRSYGIYLWHLPLVWWAGFTVGDDWKGVVGCLLGVLAGAASWRWVERPLLSHPQPVAGEPRRGVVVRRDPVADLIRRQVR